MTGSQIRNSKTVYGTKLGVREISRIKGCFSEVSPKIRCLIPKTAWGIDFLFPKSPIMKKNFNANRQMRPNIKDPFMDQT